ncbi:MAG: hypothetical protein FJ139_03000 [Deltaproteobacteria bacterium]|nr:hypothetical protein [Deltaproteobacteria bacterium]
MKRLMVLIAGSILILSTSIYATDRTSSVPVKKEPPKAVSMRPVKETKVTFTGIVKEISDTMIMVERTVKGKTETMEFALDKPVEKIKAGDKVTVSYIKKEGRNIATRVTPVVARKIVKKPTPPREPRQLSPEKTPSGK